jgi:hypothetical protein
MDVDADQSDRRFGNARIEAANRAEATALLIRCRYSVYRPEADCEGEDLVIRSPSGELRAVQLKGRPIVDRRRYGCRHLWMLFPSKPYSPEPRVWFLVPHDEFFEWVERNHRNSPKWAEHWSYPSISKALGDWLAQWMLRADIKDSSIDENSN